MSYDLLIKNGTVVDGTGGPSRRADVAIANGRIAEIGKVAEGAKKVIDASDLVVAPGFIDPHTHYDAQICWDPYITSSSWHGVTSVIMGNCGVGIAPCRPEVREIAAWDLVNVEGVPFEVLGKGAMDLALAQLVSVLDEEECEVLDLLLTESGRPVTWLAVLNRDDQPDVCMETLRKAEPLIKRGGVPQVTCRPLIIQIDLRNPFIFANLPCWNPVFNQPKESQAKVYRDPSFRNAFRKELERPVVFSGNWERLEVKEVFNPAMKPLEGKTVAAIAKERGKDGVDTFLDLGLEDELQIQFTMALFNANEERIPELITDSRVMVGLSDGGAHVDMLCDAGYCTYLLGTWVRDRQVMSLERAIKRLTSEPADFFSITHRGRR